MVMDAVQTKREQGLYINNDFDSFMIADNDRKAKTTTTTTKKNNLIDVNPENEQTKNSVNGKFRISPAEHYYIDVKNSLSTTLIEISSSSEDEVSYIKKTPSHPRNRLRRKLNKEEKKKNRKIGSYCCR